MSIPENQLVARLAAHTAQSLGTPPATVKQIRIAAALHDIGKRKIPHSILLKPGPLTPGEFEIMKTHTTLGAEMITATDSGGLNDMVRTVCLYHHEWHDGTGSYWGKRSDELPFFVPIVSICDVFVALTAARCYKAAWPPDEALDYICGKSGTQFDPVLADAFVWLVLHDPKVKKLFFSR